MIGKADVTCGGYSNQRRRLRFPAGTYLTAAAASALNRGAPERLGVGGGVWTLSVSTANGV